jgi:hypothetical protein
MWMVVGTIVLGVTVYFANALATPASGFSGTTLAVGRFGDIDVTNHLLPDGFLRSLKKRTLWLSLQKTKHLGPGRQHRLAHAPRP